MAKGVYAAALIKKHRYWPKSVPGDLTNRHFSDKEVGDVDMLEAGTEDDKSFHILFLKETDYVIKIMALRMTLDDMEGANMKCTYLGRDGDSQVKMFKYRQMFGFNFQ